MTETVKTNLTYPQPLPITVKLFLVAYALLGLIGGIAYTLGLFQNPFVFGLPEINAWWRFNFLLSGLYLNFLVLFGIYTGRRWLVNLMLIFITLGIVFQAIFYFNMQLPFFLFTLIQSAIILAFLIPLHTKVTRNWFAECKAVRVERKKAGIKSKSKLWVIISMVAWVVYVGVVETRLINDMQVTKQMFIAKAKNTLPPRLCYLFSTNKRAALLMATNKMTQQHCNQLMPSITEHCIAKIFDQIPKKMGLVLYKKEMMKVSECSAITFGNKYLTKIPGSK